MSPPPSRRDRKTESDHPHLPLTVIPPTHQPTDNDGSHPPTHDELPPTHQPTDCDHPHEPTLTRTSVIPPPS